MQKSTPVYFSMNSKTTALLLFLFRLTIGDPGAGTRKFPGGGGNDLFSNTANWENVTMPSAGDNFEIRAVCTYDVSTALS